MLIYLLDVLHQLEQSFAELDRSGAVLALRRQADLIRAMNETADVPEPDRERVRVAYAQRYGPDPDTEGSRVSGAAP